MNGILQGSVQSAATNGPAVSGILTATLLMTNAEVVSMYSSPTQVIPAPPAGSLIEVINFTLENINGGIAYLLGGQIALFFGNSNSPPLYACSSSAAATFLTTPTVTQIMRSFGDTPTSGFPKTDCVGLGIFIGNLTQNFTQAGNAGTMRVVVTYRVTSGW